MTKEEAIKILSNHEMMDVMWDKADEALNMAIDALEHQNDALLVACDLMNGAVLYGIDYDKLFDIVLDKDDIVCNFTLAEWIEENIDRFSDDDEIRHKAIERLGF